MVDVIISTTYGTWTESLLDNPKLTNLLKSENTSLLPSPALAPPPSSLFSPVSGRLALLPPGLAKLLAVREAVEDGSVSSDVKNDVLSSSERL
jgi:hypothetical protein